MQRIDRRTFSGLIIVGLAAVSIGLSTDLHSPPRYDGAGYSVLALAIRTGRGYHEIHQPENRPHTHFPPGYPLALASLWAVTGRSDFAAHLLSIGCAVTAVGIGWLWILRIEGPRVANLLAVTLAMNWTWAMNGGGIQSEPLYLFLSLLVLVRARRSSSVVLGLLIGVCILTRHVGICLLAAVLIDRGLDQRWRQSILIGLTSALVVLPWIIWLAVVRRSTQADLLQSKGFGSLFLSQILFYARRIPDALTGPFVEVATVFRHSQVVAGVATVGAVFLSLLILVGLIRATLNPRKRLAGLVPLVTLPLLLVWPFTEAGRFLVPLVPCLLVGFVEGLSGLVQSVMRSFHHLQSSSAASKIRHKPRVLAAWIILLMALSYPVYALMTGRARAQRQTHFDFDASCAWIKTEAKQAGPIFSRHPAEVFWQTDRQAIAPASDDIDALARQIDEQNIAYLVVDPDRFANAPPIPLTKLTRTWPDRFRKVREGLVEVYEVVRE